MTGSVFSFTAMAIAARAISGVHDTFEIMLWRSVLGFALVLVVGGALRRLREIRRDRMGQHLVRNLFHFHRAESVVLGADHDPAGAGLCA